MVAHRVACTDAEGPGKRYALWLQGCPLRCPGCCNPEFLPFLGGASMFLDDLLREIDPAIIEGISFLGGEPTSQAEGAALLARAVQSRGLSVMVYSGYTLAELHARNDPHIDALLNATDILVDGPYIREQPETHRRWIGSANQQVHFLTERYRAEDPCWQHKNTLELRMVNGEVHLNGFPTTKTIGVKAWKRRP